MVARHYYRNDDGDLEHVPTVLRWGYELKEQSEEGAAAICQVVVDDPDMTLDFVGHRRWIVYEDESEDYENHVIFSGFVGIQRIAHKGGDITQPLGRVWTLDLVDMNTLWTNRLMVGADSDIKRPAETDVERMEWLVATEEMGYFDDLTLIAPDDPVNLQPLQTRGMYTGQIADACAQDSGKNWWIGCTGVLGSGSEIFIWYGADSLLAYESPLALSNDPADLVMADVNDGTALTYPLGDKTELVRDPQRIYSGAYVEHQKGAAYRREPATATAFTLSGRDISSPAPELKSESAAFARAGRILADSDSQEEVITTAPELPASKASMLRTGMLISIRATHEPGWESGRLCRILNASHAPISGGRRYRVAIEATPISDAPASCSAALAASATETNTGLESDTTTASVSSSISSAGIVLAMLCAGNGNTPNSTNMGTPSGFDTLDVQSDFGRLTYFIGTKAVSAGTQSTSASFTPGFASVGAWSAAQVWLPWTAATVVQETVAGTGPSAYQLGSTPTPGNTILLFGFSDKITEPTVPGLNGPATGWTRLFWVLSGEAAGDGVANIACWARCVQEGDGLDYDYSSNGAGSLMTPGGYVVELATS